MSRFQLITFDCYSALFDYQATLAPALADHLSLPSAVAEDFLAVWRGKQLEAAGLSNSLNKGRTSFRECTRLSLRYVACRQGINLNAEQQEALVRAWDNLKPWPEASEVLKAARDRGYRLALLSNGDQAMLEALAKNLDVPVDHVYSSETCGYYKPHPDVYQLPVSGLKITVGQYLHVAGGAGDVIGAKAAGVACYWSNRGGDTILMPSYRPDFQGDTLNELLDVL